MARCCRIRHAGSSLNKPARRFRQPDASQDPECRIRHAGSSTPELTQRFRQPDVFRRLGCQIRHAGSSLNKPARRFRQPDASQDPGCRIRHAGSSPPEPARRFRQPDAGPACNHGRQQPSEGARCPLRRPTRLVESTGALGFSGAAGFPGARNPQPWPMEASAPSWLHATREDAREGNPAAPAVGAASAPRGRKHAAGAASAQRGPQAADAGAARTPRGPHARRVVGRADGVIPWIGSARSLSTSPARTCSRCSRADRAARTPRPRRPPR